MNFIYQIEKKEEKEKINLSIFSVDSKKQTIKEEILLNYEILCLKNDFKALNIKTDRLILAEKVFLTINDKNVVKIQIKSKELYNYIYSELREHKFKTFEADLPIEHKYLINNNIKLIEKDKYLPLKYLSIDIETVGKTINIQEIILISSFSPDSIKANKVYVNLEKLENKNKEKIDLSKLNGDFELILCENEKEVLEKFKENIIKFEPQVIIGWNVIDFDFKVIKNRMKTHSINFNFSKYQEGESKLRIIKDFFRDSSLNCSSVLVFDVIALLKTNFIVFNDYKLDTVARKVLGDSKIEVNDNLAIESGFDDKLKAIADLFQSNPMKLIEYNFKDSVLVSQILEKLKLLELMCKRSILTGTPLSRVKSPIATLDIMYLKELHKKGLVANSNFNYSDSTPIEGAYVIEPIRGFYEDIFVFDFKSLYPSIIMTFNIDPFSFVKNETGNKKLGIRNEKNIIAPNSSEFSYKKGILPDLILKLYNERDVAKKDKDEIKSYALKTTMNSFYGAIASPKSRYYNKDVGGAITSFGRFIIQKAVKFIENNGLIVIYGDTDSVFVKVSNLENKSLEDKKKIGKKIEGKINMYFNEWVEKEFKQKSFLSIEFEKLYSKFFIASKKRYVGFDEMSKKLGFVGMEAIRGDWTELAKKFQVKMVDIIFNENKENKESKIKKFILDYIYKLNNGNFDDLLVYNKKTTKPLSEYVKMTPPHVKAAREVKNFSGRLVKYVMLKEGAKHISLIGNSPKYDYNHYIEKQLKGVSDDLLESLGIDFDEVARSKKQKSLKGFF